MFEPVQVTLSWDLWNSRQTMDFRHTLSICVDRRWCTCFYTWTWPPGFPHRSWGWISEQSRGLDCRRLPQHIVTSNSFCQPNSTEVVQLCLSHLEFIRQEILQFNAFLEALWRQLWRTLPRTFSRHGHRFQCFHPLPERQAERSPWMSCSAPLPDFARLEVRSESYNHVISHVVMSLRPMSP